MAAFIAKVFLLSLIVSVAIKYGGPYLSVSPTATNALMAILVPPLVMAIALALRWQITRKDDT